MITFGSMYLTKLYFGKNFPLFFFIVLIVHFPVRFHCLEMEGSVDITLWLIKLLDVDKIQLNVTVEVKYRILR